MSNVIRFLESLGNASALPGQAAAEYASAVALLDIDEQQRQALLDRNQVELNALLGGRQKVLCSVFSPDQEPTREDVPQEQDEPVREIPAEPE